MERELVSRDSRLRIGIKRHGFNNDFMREVNSYTSQLKYDRIEEVYDKWNIPKYMDELIPDIDTFLNNIK